MLWSSSLTHDKMLFLLAFEVYSLTGMQSQSRAELVQGRMHLLRDYEEPVKREIVF
jgi:hypothetical protein